MSRRVGRPPKAPAALPPSASAAAPAAPSATGDAAGVADLDVRAYTHLLVDRELYSDDEGDDTLNEPAETLPARIRLALRRRYPRSRAQVQRAQEPGAAAAASPAPAVRGQRFACPIPDCDRSFLNIEGLIYHGKTFIHRPHGLLRGTGTDAEIAAVVAAGAESGAKPVRRLLAVSFYDGIRRVIPFIIAADEGNTKKARKRKVIEITDSDDALPAPARQTADAPELPASSSLSGPAAGERPTRSSRAKSPLKYGIIDGSDDEEHPGVRETRRNGGSAANDSDHEPPRPVRRARPPPAEPLSTIVADLSDQPAVQLQAPALPRWMPAAGSARVLTATEIDAHLGPPQDTAVRCSGHAREGWRRFETARDADKHGFVLASAVVPHALAWRSNVVDGCDVLAVGGYGARERPVRKQCTPPGTHGSVEFWQVPLSTADARPRLWLCWAHEHGHTWSLAWCPGAEAEGSVGPAQAPRRLGLLAAATSDGRIRVVAVPHPDDIRPAASPDPLVVALEPVWTIELPGHPFFSVDWGRPLQGRTLAAGCLDGTVAVYDVHRAHTNGVAPPACLFDAGTACVDVVSVHWSRPGCIAVSCAGEVSVWDTGDVVEPIWSRRSLTNDQVALWTPRDQLVVVTGDEVATIAPNETCVLEAWRRTLLVTRLNTVWSCDVAADGSVAVAGADGCVFVSGGGGRRARDQTASGEVLRNVPVLVGGGPEAEAMPLTYVRIGRGDSADGVTLKRRFLDGQESLPTYPPELAFLKAVWCRDTRAGRWLAVGSATTLVHVRHIP